MRRNSLHYPTTTMRKLAMSHLPPLSQTTPTAGYGWYKGPGRRRGSDPSQEVRCLTLTKRQLTVYLHPALSHDQAVRAVEDSLDSYHYRQDKHSPFSITSKMAQPSFSSPNPLPRQEADLLRKSSYDSVVDERWVCVVYLGLKGKMCAVTTDKVLGLRSPLVRFPASLAF